MYECMYVCVYVCIREQWSAVAVCHNVVLYCCAVILCVPLSGVCFVNPCHGDVVIRGRGSGVKQIILNT
jgi:hypothetical protein